VGEPHGRLEAFELGRAEERGVLGELGRGRDAGAGRPIGGVLDDDGRACRRATGGDGKVDGALEEAVGLLELEDVLGVDLTER
jgi:hypothetical protein